MVSPYQPTSCFDCTCLECDSEDKPITSTTGLGFDSVTCKKYKSRIAVNLAKTQAVCFEDPQVVTMEHTHLQDITPKEETL